MRRMACPIKFSAGMGLSRLGLASPLSVISPFSAMFCILCRVSFCWGEVSFTKAILPGFAWFVGVGLVIITSDTFRVGCMDSLITVVLVNPNSLGRVAQRVRQTHMIRKILLRVAKIWMV